ncbi:MAG: protein translocase subunit SecD [Parcubacteria group bacterium]|nr:protein translocase subunit SecD [Parcubacteria group bacterium]|tara:strand:- start:25606 stop:27000 length:1395 start_codon:yes stop_codon:yes gene_type:complete
MPKKKLYTTIILIFVLAFFTFNLSYPKYFNRGIDFLNTKVGFSFPHFWDIPFRLGLDLQGGAHLLYEADLSQIEKDEYGSAMEGLRDVIERRVNLFGVQEPIIQVQEQSGHHRLIVELAGVENLSQAIEMIGQTPFLEFKEQRPEEETEKILEKQKELEGKTFEEIQEVEGWQLAFEDPYFMSTQLSGRYLDKAELAFDQTTYQPQISLQFNDEGSEIFKNLTSRNIGKPLAIYIDQVIISAPTVHEEISGGRAQITGNFTIEESKKLVRDLNAGALPVPIELISQQQVGPTLGAVSLEKSLKAGMIGLLAVILFMVFFYRLPGILAALSLGIYVALILNLFKIIPVTLTLAGIGGFILSIGMAIDANILIFARLREELKEEKSFSMALEEGFKRAWPSIRDGNLTTLIVALILFSFGTSFIKGFALTLSIGIIISMFSAIFITQNFLRYFEGTKLEKITWLWK